MGKNAFRAISEVVPPEAFRDARAVAADDGRRAVAIVRERAYTAKLGRTLHRGSRAWNVRYGVERTFRKRKVLSANDPIADIGCIRRHEAAGIYRFRRWGGGGRWTPASGQPP